MCDAVSAVPAGKPVTLAVTSNVAAVTFPAASFDRLNVRVAVPEPPASVPVIGGTSFAGSSTAVYVDDDEPSDGAVIVLLSSHAAATPPSMMTARRGMMRFMCELQLRIRRTFFRD